MRLAKLSALVVQLCHRIQTRILSRYIHLLIYSTLVAYEDVVTYFKYIRSVQAGMTTRRLYRGVASYLSGRLHPQMPPKRIV